MKSCKQSEILIQNLILDSISDAEKKVLNTHIQACDRCNKIYKMHHSLDAGPTRKADTTPDETHFQTMRQNVLEQIIKKPNPRFDILKLIAGLLKQKTMIFRPAIAIALFLVALIAGYYSNQMIGKGRATDQDMLIQRIRQMAIKNHSLDDVDKSPLYISHVGIDRDFSGQVVLDFNVTTAVEYRGDMNDPLVQEVVTQALVNATNDGSRLDAIALSPQLMDTKVKEALIFSMLHDKNPAIRINAMAVLGQIQFDCHIQEAVIKVLNSEQTVHMRLAAIELLTQDQANVQNIETILKDRIEHDENSSVKLKAARSLNIIERSGS